MKIEKEVVPVLEVKQLSYTYQGEQKALQDISLQIWEGEKTVVLGSNGAGKSTFFLLANGVLSPTAGEIYYRGEKIGTKNINTLRKNVGLVFQEADNQIIASTVAAEVSFGPMNLKLPEEEVQERVEEALRYMDISKMKERPPHYLSGGEKRRVGIADIIAMKPEVIIFDEPTAALDPINAEMLEEVLDRLAVEKKTLLLSTHDVDFAYRFAERLIVFHEGRILADGTPVEVFQNETVLKKAHLKKPVMMEVVEILKKQGIWEEGEEFYPRTPEELSELL